jgi:hypothetical protein
VIRVHVGNLAASLVRPCRSPRLRSCCSISAYNSSHIFQQCLMFKSLLARGTWNADCCPSTVMKISPFLCLVLLLTISEGAAAQQLRNDHDTQLTHACGLRGLGAGFLNRNCVDWRGRETNQPNHNAIREQNSNALAVWCSRLGRVPNFGTGLCM